MKLGQTRPGAGEFWRWALGLFGVWTLLALLSATQVHSLQSFSEMTVPISWGLAFGRAFEEWYLWGCFSLLVLLLARRHPIERGRIPVQLVLHLGAALAIAVGFVATYALLMHGRSSLMDGSELTFSKVFRKAFVFYTHEYVLFYSLILLAYNGWRYYRSSRERELQTAALQTELVQARLLALRMQLNPHFLFNVLNTISALIHERPNDADRMVVRLSELLRLSLDRACEKEEVTLSRELAFLERYLEVEKIRFEDRLTVKYDIQPGIQSARLPCLILQPLVENALRHGVECCESAGCIEIAARREGETLELSVTDNGPGLPTDYQDNAGEGIGLRNTRSRLLHLYGDRQGLELKSSPGAGVRAVVRLPFRLDDPKDPDREAETAPPQGLLMERV